MIINDKMQIQIQPIIENQIKIETPSFSKVRLPPKESVRIDDIVMQTIASFSRSLSACFILLSMSKKLATNFSMNY